MVGRPYRRGWNLWLAATHAPKKETTASGPASQKRVSQPARRLQNTRTTEPKISRAPKISDNDRRGPKILAGLRLPATRPLNELDTIAHFKLQIPASANSVKLTTVKTPPAPRAIPFAPRKKASQMTLVDKTARLCDLCKLQAGLA
jgi:hypothetical protein